MPDGFSRGVFAARLFSENLVPIYTQGRLNSPAGPRFARFRLVTQTMALGLGIYVQDGLGFSPPALLVKGQTRLEEGKAQYQSLVNTTASSSNSVVPLPPKTP
jgi:hypothetical protein